MPRGLGLVLLPLFSLVAVAEAQPAFQELKPSRRISVRYVVEQAVTYEKFVVALTRANVSFEPKSNLCIGGGKATKEQVERVLASITDPEKWCGKNSLAGGIWVQPPPAFLTPQTDHLGPLLLRVKPIPTQKAGTALHWSVEIRNPADQPYSLGWGEDSLDYVLLDAKGEPVRWLNRFFFNMPLYGVECPPQSVCSPDLALRGSDAALVLRDYRNVLPSGTYRLRVNVKNVTLEGQEFNITLPDVAFEIVR